VNKNFKKSVLEIKYKMKYECKDHNLHSWNRKVVPLGPLFILSYGTFKNSLTFQKVSPIKPSINFYEIILKYFLSITFTKSFYWIFFKKILSIVFFKMEPQTTYSKVLYQLSF